MTRSRPSSPDAVASLPALTLTGTVPAADVLAVATRPGDDGAVLLADLDDVGVLRRDKAKGEAGELVALPTTDRVLALGTGDG